MFHAQPGQKTSNLNSWWTIHATGPWSWVSRSKIGSPEVSWSVLRSLIFVFLQPDHCMSHFSCPRFHLFVDVTSYKRARASGWVPGWPGWPFSTFLFSLSLGLQFKQRKVKILREYIKTQSHQHRPQWSWEFAAWETKDPAQHNEKRQETQDYWRETIDFARRLTCTNTAPDVPHFLSLSGVRSYLAWPFQMQEWSKIFWAKCKDRLEMTNQGL